MPQNKKILIVEDEVDLCLLLKDYFIRKKYEVAFSHSLTEGRELLASYHPDILFLDNNLPDGDGWALAPGIAADYPETYIVLISAFNPRFPAMPALAKFRTIQKPFGFAELDKQFSTL